MQNIDNYLASAYNHIQMGKLKFTLANILFWISIIASCLLLENVAFLSSDLKGGLNNTIFFMLFALAMIGYLAYFIVGHVKNKTTIDFFLIAVLGIGFGCALVSIFSFKQISFESSNPDYSFSYMVDAWEHVRQALSLVTFFVTLYALLFFFNKNHPSIRKLSFIFIIILIICYISIIYSLIAEYKLYEDIFLTVDSSKEMQSLFWNPNMFAGFILMGIASAMGLNYFKKNVFSIISIPLFLIEIIFIGSLTSILIAIAAILVYSLIEIIFVIRKNVKKGVWLLALYLFGVVAIYIIFACGLQLDMGNFSIFCNYLKRKIVNADYLTFTHRTFLWAASLKLLGENPLNLIFGFGFRNSQIVLGGYQSAIKLSEYAPISSHSAYIQILMNFGIIGATIYGSFLIYYLYCFIRLLRKDARFALIYAVIGGIFLGYASMESVICFNPNVQGLLVGLVFFLPMINKYKHYKHPQLGDDALEVENPATLDEDLITKSMAKIFMSLTFVACSFFAIEMFREVESLKYMLLNIVASLFIFTLFFPFIISSQSRSKGRVPYVIIVALNIGLVLGGLTYLVIRYYQNPTIVAEDAKWVYPILLIIVLVFETLFYAIIRKRSFKEYLQTFIGTTKLSFIGLLGLAAPILVFILLKDKIEVSPLTLIIYPFIGLELYFLFSYIIPFGDLKEIINQYNDIAVHSLKMEVVKDRLEVFNDKRKN